MADEDKEWLIRLESPIFPVGIQITRMAATDEVRDILATVREKLPEWRAETFDLNRIMRDLDRSSKQSKDVK